MYNDAECLYRVWYNRTKTLYTVVYALATSASSLALSMRGHFSWNLIPDLQRHVRPPNQKLANNVWFFNISDYAARYEMTNGHGLNMV